MNESWLAVAMLAALLLGIILVFDSFLQKEFRANKRLRSELKHTKLMFARTKLQLQRTKTVTNTPDPEPRHFYTYRGKTLRVP